MRVEVSATLVAIAVAVDGPPPEVAFSTAAVEKAAAR
jgi:hypothetical protein